MNILYKKKTCNDKDLQEKRRQVVELIRYNLRRQVKKSWEYVRMKTNKVKWVEPVKLSKVVYVVCIID